MYNLKITSLILFILLYTIITIVYSLTEESIVAIVGVVVSNIGWLIFCTSQILYTIYQQRQQRLLHNLLNEQNFNNLNRPFLEDENINVNNFDRPFLEDENVNDNIMYYNQKLQKYLFTTLIGLLCVAFGGCIGLYMFKECEVWKTCNNWSSPTKIQVYISLLVMLLITIGIFIKCIFNVCINCL